MQYTQIPVETFNQLQINAGMLLKKFAPNVKPAEEDKMGATSGGINFTASAIFSDFGEDIDNCAKNMKELKKQDSVEVKLSGTFVTINTDACRRIIGAADIDDDDPSMIIPRNDLTEDDFNDLYWVGDYGATDGSYVLIHIFDALSTGGFQLKTTDKAKGKFPFEFTGHYSITNQDRVPYEIAIVNVEAADETV